MTSDSFIAQARKGPSPRPAAPPSTAKVRNVVAVGSGKGGVGKSTVTANLAAALARLGASVGVLDADVYGPSQPGMLGAAHMKADLQAQALKPLEAHGVKFMSVQTLLPQDGPVVWRAPMAVKLLQDFLAHIEWGDLDYLLIDMPPGTGDIQLTLAQGAGLTGAVVVTTPQQAATGVARKGLQMFQQVKVPILGIVENMSGHVCAKCGHKEDTFLSGGGAALAKETGVPLLGVLPLDPAVVKSGDAGTPAVLGDAASPAARAFLDLARAFERETAAANGRASAGPKSLGVSAAGALEVVWADGQKQVFNPYHLRLNCPCAACVDEHTGEKILDAKRVPLDVRVAEARPVGSYGVSPRFSDGHDTGIYTFERLKGLGGAAGQAPVSFSV
jgi:ATP-binding protein involved in chromosome partitioning